MRTIPRNLRMQPYSRAKEAEQHRIAIQASLSPLEHCLLMYQGLPNPTSYKIPTRLLCL